MQAVTRGLAAVALGGLATLGVAQPAHAAPCTAGTYPPSVSCTPSVTLSTTTVTVGGSVDFSVTGFAPGSPVLAELHSTVVTLGTFTASSQGTVAGRVRIPSSVPAGSHTLVFTGRDGSGAAQTARVSIVVARAAAGTGGAKDLPFGGFPVVPVAVVGAGLLGGGAVFVVASRRRKAAASGS